MSFRTVEVNSGLTRVYDGDKPVGYARVGLDHKWYPMLPGETSRGAAVHRIVLAHEAILRLQAEVDEAT